MTQRIFKTKHGKTVIGQKPNVFLWAWIIFTILKRILDGSAAEWAGYAATASLVIWSLLEVVGGVNVFRRFLGVTILLVIVYGLIN